MHTCSRASLVLVLVVGCALRASPTPPVPSQLGLKEGFQFSAKIVRERRRVTDSNPEERPNDYTGLPRCRETLVVFRCTVAERGTNGDLRISFQYERIRDQSSPGGDAYDSTHPHGVLVGSSRRELLDALVGRSFVARLSARGEVQAIEGFAEMYRDFRDEMIKAPWWIERYSEERRDIVRQSFEETSRETFEKFFSCYWPLSEGALRATVQEFFLIWPDESVGPKASWRTRTADPTVALRKYNSWTLRAQRADSVIVELAADVRTDLNLCDPNVVDRDYEPPWSWDDDFLSLVCRWHRKGMHPAMYAGERRGSFEIDPKSGMVQRGSSTEELRGICPVRELDGDWVEPVACPSARTETVTIEVTPKGD